MLTSMYHQYIIDDDEDRNVKILAQYYWVQRIKSAYRIENI